MSEVWRRIGEAAVGGALVVVVTFLVPLLLLRHVALVVAGAGAGLA